MKAAAPDLSAFMDDPNWASFVPPLDNSGPKCRLPAHADCTPLDVERVAANLEAGGTLGRMRGYEPRPGQVDMLRAITRAYNEREHLMIEAGTGVGKSLAYLVPSVQWSYVNDTPVVISTATRNLQSQLIAQDLPRAAKTLGPDAPRFRATLLKGRANYLCLRALGEYMQGGWWTLSEEERLEFARCVAWLRQTPDGDLDDLGSETLRPHLSCPGEDCAGRACRYRDQCFVAKARARALKAHMVVVNHALVLAEATNPGSGLLPAYGRLVFDEAHNLEDIATDFFSYELSRPVLLQLLGKLARTARARRGPARTRGLLGTLERQLQKGAFQRGAEAEAVRAGLTQAQVRIRFVQKAADALFDRLGGLFAPAPKNAIIRYRVAPPVAGAKPDAPGQRQYALKGLFTDYRADQWDEGALTAAATAFESALARLQAVLDALAETLAAADEDAPTTLFGDLAAQVKGVSESFTAFILESKFILAANDPARVFWAERRPGNPRQKLPAFIRLVAAPLSVAEEMKKCFYDPKDSVVLCSATLRAGDKFDYMARKLGVSLLDAARVKLLVASSPFDYFRQALVLAADYLPDIAAACVDYVQALVPLLRNLAAATRGRMLVLFTAYEMMRDVAARVRPLLESDGARLLVQGDGLSREAMTQALKDAADASPVILFGAQSFWEGVDVPGAALSCVVLVRLPFPQVGEPIVEARSEKVVVEGGSAFRDYLLPEALIRFRQGFGRLVRTRRDTGVVVITDPRLAQKNYGALFRKAIPATVHVVTSSDELLSRAGAFLAE